MKRLIPILISAALCLCLSILLCSCSSIHPSKLVGIWQGDGTLRSASFGPSPIPSAPFDRAQELTLLADGTGTVTSPSGPAPLTWNASDSTLTLSFGQLGSWGMRYECKGDTLILRTGEGASVFTKAS